MRKYELLLLLSLSALIPGCRPLADVTTHRFKEEAVYQHSGNQQMLFTGLQNDNQDVLLEVSSDDYVNTVLIKDLAEKIIAQINFRNKIRNVKVLTDPLTNDKWLFVSYNDQKRTYLEGFNYIWQKGMKRVELAFESIARTDTMFGKNYPEWKGTIIPELIRDIDLDGKSELVCRTTDAFTVNPRGLAVYDMTSGALNWRLDLSTNVYSVLCDDFNNDGNLELLCGNAASKNTLEVKQGIDDFNGWLFVVSVRGEMLRIQKMVEGYGSIMLDVDDPDRDGEKELQTVITTWGDQDNYDMVQSISYNGRSFVTERSWKVIGSFEGNTVDTFYQTLTLNDAKRFLLVAKNSPLLVLDERLVPVRGTASQLVKRVCDIEDIDRDGSSEVLVQTRNNEFLILNSDLRVKAVLKSPFGAGQEVSAHLIKTGMNSDCMIALTSSGELRYYSYAQEHITTVLYGLVVKYRQFFNMLFFFLLLLMGFELFRRKIIFASAIDKVEQGIMVLGHQNKIQFMNKYLLDLLQEEHVISRNLRKMKLEIVMPEVAISVRGFRKAVGNSMSGRITLGKEGREFIVEYTKLLSLTRRYFILIKPVYNGANGISEAKLEWASTARRLSHNVRRHINNLILALKHIQKAVQGSENEQYADIIRTETERIRVFTHAFQRFAELDKVVVATEDVVPVIQNCLSKLDLNKTIELALELPATPLMAKIEPIRLSEALMNLLQNSVEAMPEGGILHISAQEFLNHQVEEKGLSVLIEIEDSGIGIPERYMPDIWTPFFTTKNDGTGIGLPETRKNIESMGGKIEVQSEESFGTVVTIWLKGELDA